MRGEMRERTSLSTDRKARRGRGSRKLVAALSAVALAGIGLAAATPASATDSYKAPVFAVANNPGGVAFTPDGKSAVVVNADIHTLKSALTVYDASTRVKKWSIALGGPWANGVTVSPDGTEAFAAYMGDDTHSGGVTVVNLVSKSIVASINDGAIWDAAFTPDGSKVYALAPEFGSTNGTVHVIDAATHSDIAQIPVGEGPYDLVFSPDGARAYVLNGGTQNDTGSISVINVATNLITATIPLGLLPSGIAITPDGSTLFATNYGDGSHSGTVSVVSTATNLVVSTIASIGVGPSDLRVSPDGSQVWVLNSGAGSVAVIDEASKAIVQRFTLTGQPWMIAFTPDGSHAWVSLDGLDANVSGTIGVFDVKSARWNPAVNRVSGTDRYQTSVNVAKQAFPTSAPVVFVATGTGFADALAAAAPAAKLKGPLLLTDPAGLPASVKTEITSLHPSTIYIVGGTGAISTTVEQQLKPLATTVTRVAGTDRFDTARKVIDKAFPTMTKVYVATGMNFPDALSASAAAGAAGLPVLLVNGTKSSLDTATTDFLSSHHANAFTVIGGPNVVSAGIATQLGASGPVKRIFGGDRYATSQLINSDAFTSGTGAYFATGTSFADALSGAVLAAVKGSPLYVVNPVCVPDGSEADLAGRGVTGVTLIGGTGALSAAVAAMHNC